MMWLLTLLSLLWFILNNMVKAQFTIGTGSGIPLDQCTAAMVKSDANSDSFLNSDEFLTFIQEVGKTKCYKITSFDPTMKLIFQGLACACVEDPTQNPITCCLTNQKVSIAGASLSSRTTNQTDMLNTTCNTVAESIPDLCGVGNVTQGLCKENALSADANKDGKLNRTEYATFVSLFNNCTTPVIAGLFTDATFLAVQLQCWLSLNFTGCQGGKNGTISIEGFSNPDGTSSADKAFLANLCDSTGKLGCDLNFLGNSTFSLDNFTFPPIGNVSLPTLDNETWPGDWNFSLPSNWNFSIPNWNSSDLFLEFNWTQCIDDAKAADANSNGELTPSEYLSFLAKFTGCATGSQLDATQQGAFSALTNSCIWQGTTGCTPEEKSSIALDGLYTPEAQRTLQQNSALQGFCVISSSISVVSCFVSIPSGNGGPSSGSSSGGSSGGSSSGSGSPASTIPLAPTIQVSPSVPTTPTAISSTKPSASTPGTGAGSSTKVTSDCADRSHLVTLACGLFVILVFELMH